MHHFTELTIIRVDEELFVYHRYGISALLTCDGRRLEAGVEQCTCFLLETTAKHNNEASYAMHKRRTAAYRTFMKLLQITLLLKCDPGLIFVAIAKNTLHVSKLSFSCSCVAQCIAESIALAAQRLWVRFPGNTCTDKKLYNLNAL